MKHFIVTKYVSNIQFMLTHFVPGYFIKITKMGQTFIYHPVNKIGSEYFVYTGHIGLKWC